MKTSIKCIMPNGEGSDELIINCDIEYTDLIVKDNKFVSIYCNNVSIDEEASSKEYKEAFEVTPDGDYHILIEFKKNPQKLRIFSKHYEGSKPTWRILIEGV